MLSRSLPTANEGTPGGLTRCPQAQGHPVTLLHQLLRLLRSTRPITLECSVLRSVERGLFPEGDDDVEGYLKIWLEWAWTHHMNSQTLGRSLFAQPFIHGALSNGISADTFYRTVPDDSG